ncbi:carbohydrate esterase family 3 protein [Thozetella sp. PMI_491]|nr:carbohydrate esterase family 3 protein [Thozetella sp. PMI_491]
MNALLLAFATPLFHSGVAVNMNNLGARALSPIANALPLRIMPLGASITFGQASTDGNGYRGSLRDQLVSGGNAVNMVGTRQHGTMRDNDVEGWPGFIIDSVHAKAQIAVPLSKPNVILINAGTNDCLGNINITGASDRMERMVLDLYSMSPQATVILSSLIINTNATVDSRVLVVNAEYKALVEKLQAQNRRIVYAEMHGTDGPGMDDMHDQTHPNDNGYRMMANIWYKGLVTASNNGYIVAAEPVAGLQDDGAI